MFAKRGKRGKRGCLLSIDILYPLIPAFKATSAICDSLVSSGGISSAVVGKEMC